MLWSAEHLCRDCKWCITVWEEFLLSAALWLKLLLVKSFPVQSQWAAPGCIRVAEMTDAFWQCYPSSSPHTAWQRRCTKKGMCKFNPCKMLAPLSPSPQPVLKWRKLLFNAILSCIFVGFHLLSTSKLNDIWAFLNSFRHGNVELSFKCLCGYRERSHMISDSHVTSIWELIRAACLWSSSPYDSLQQSCPMLHALDALLQGTELGGALWFEPGHLKLDIILVPLLTEQERITLLQASPFWSAVWHTAFCFTVWFQGEPVNSIWPF